jgi:hypothetical protein
VPLGDLPLTLQKITNCTSTVDLCSRFYPGWVTITAEARLLSCVWENRATVKRPAVEGLNRTQPLEILNMHTQLYFYLIRPEDIKGSLFSFGCVLRLRHFK